jgi:hypothetical protein
MSAPLNGGDQQHTNSSDSCCECCSNLVDSYLRDTLAVLSSVEDGPCDTAGVLPLQEERLRLAVLESEDLAVAADVELTL